MQLAKAHSMLPITIVIIICSLEALTKGWVSFVLVPASVIILIVYGVLQKIARQHFQDAFGVTIRLVSYLLTAAILFSYVCIAGGGDTDQIVAFGFYKTTINDTFILTLDNLANKNLIITVPVLFAVLTIILVASQRKAQLLNATEKSHTTKS